MLLGMSSQNHDDDGALDLGRAQLLVFSRPICYFSRPFLFFIKKVLHLLHGNSCGIIIFITSPNSIIASYMKLLHLT
jgi:hypothetical protein